MSNKMTVQTKTNAQAISKAGPVPTRSRPFFGPEWLREPETHDLKVQLANAQSTGHHFSAVRVQGTAPALHQAKLQVGPVGDQYEQEADRVAKQVVNLPFYERQPPVAKGPREAEEEIRMKQQGLRQEQSVEHHLRKLATFQPAGKSGGQVVTEVEFAINRVRGGGQQLDGGLQAQMSATLGYDFSGVRVHTGTAADRATEGLKAKALTYGGEIFFRRGEYDPTTRPGRELIVHELSHVVQQGFARRLGDKNQEADTQGSGRHSGARERREHKRRTKDRQSRDGGAGGEHGDPSRKTACCTPANTKPTPRSVASKEVRLSGGGAYLLVRPVIVHTDDEGPTREKVITILAGVSHIWKEAFHVRFLTPIPTAVKEGAGVVQKYQYLGGFHKDIGQENDLYKFYQPMNIQLHERVGLGVAPLVDLDLIFTKMAPREGFSIRAGRQDISGIPNVYGIGYVATEKSASVIRTHVSQVISDAAHELGHIIGYEHGEAIEDPQKLMYPYVWRGQTPASGIRGATIPRGARERAIGYMKELAKRREQTEP